jgi:hypothetical protein
MYAPRTYFKLEGILESVNMDAREMVVLAHGIRKTFKVSSNCTILFNGGIRELTEVQPGYRVQVVYTVWGGELMAFTLKVSWYPWFRRPTKQLSQEPSFPAA